MKLTDQREKLNDNTRTIACRRQNACGDCLPRGANSSDSAANALADAGISYQFHRCSHCDCERLRLMRAQEFKEARKTLGLTQSQLGQILNTNPATIRKWEMNDDRSTSRDPNPVAARVMKWMLNGFRPPEFPTSSDSNKGADE